MKKLPNELLEKQRAAGRARQAMLTPEQRRQLGKLAWAKRVERYRRAATEPCLVSQSR
jgi:hypothetical protein